MAGRSPCDARKPARPAGPGVFSLGELAIYLGVHRNTARRIVNALGLRDRNLRKQPTYAWTELWRALKEPQALIADPAAWRGLKAPLLDVAAVAERRRCDPSTIRRYVAEKRIPVIRLPGRLLRFHAASIDAPHRCARTGAESTQQDRTQ